MLRDTVCWICTPNSSPSIFRSRFGGGRPASLISHDHCIRFSEYQSRQRLHLELSAIFGHRKHETAVTKTRPSRSCNEIAGFEQRLPDLGSVAIGVNLESISLVIHSVRNYRCETRSDITYHPFRPDRSWVYKPSGNHGYAGIDRSCWNPFSSPIGPIRLVFGFMQAVRTGLSGCSIIAEGSDPKPSQNQLRRTNSRVH